MYLLTVRSQIIVQLWFWWDKCIFPLGTISEGSYHHKVICWILQFELEAVIGSSTTGVALPEVLEVPEGAGWNVLYLGLSSSELQDILQPTFRRTYHFDPWIGKIPWRRKWQPTPVFFPREFHGQRSLVGHSPWGHKESDPTEWLTRFWQKYPLQVTL